MTWKNGASGKYQITAKATDNSGAVSTSGAIEVRVSPSVKITLYST